ncbi:MAG: hypothetical protein A4E70_00552 [Syntrophus sp. PtaU1.Bin005]|mgnify:CR=1 FL=1|uniref:hypothetical protein n=1 Tax=Syntrophus TaxID=43773 RepID=UPI0009D18F4D|nr:MAG: hypothetical protein A4E69_03188 [Syntrophus sp. PtaB.Bin138]OPY82935.1 MAG: hypothetical protein A4E70_00552 [Syntrophus sp. PtaU1.Bin005]
MANRTVIGILVTNRVANAQQVQKVLTEYGCSIKTRLGLHEVDEKTCSTSGLLLLELFGDEGACNDLEKNLRAVPGLQVQKMVFES